MRFPPPFLRFLAVLVALPVLFACSNDLPDVEGTISPEAQDAPFPKLLPQSEIFPDTAASQTRSIEEQATALERRIALLKLKAAALRGRDIYEGQEALRAIR
ncbi:MAG: hypothetical protein HKP40_10550 [Litoreibacter sp.]|nr:hypothetical protein [Litoreibacter sp.]